MSEIDLPQVPSLHDHKEGILLFESAAILQYLAEKYGKQLLGKTDMTDTTL